MTASPATDEPSQVAAAPLSSGRRIDRVWVVCSAVASVLILIAAFLPLWRLELVAPQYPRGLFITAYGYDMTGDVDEINELNHYVGLTPLKPENVLELKLFPFGVAGILAVILLGVYKSRTRKLRIASAAAAWSLPLFMLVDLQYWLYRQGHDIDPDAALTLEPFTPRVLGSTEVLNFHSVGTVSIGFWMFVAAALALTIGPWLARFVRDSWSNTGKTAAVAADSTSPTTSSRRSTSSPSRRTSTSGPPSRCSREAPDGRAGRGGPRVCAPDRMLDVGRCRVLAHPQPPAEHRVVASGGCGAGPRIVQQLLLDLFHEVVVRRLRLVGEQRQWHTVEQRQRLFGDLVLADQHVEHDRAPLQRNLFVLEGVVVDRATDQRRQQGRLGPVELAGVGADAVSYTHLTLPTIYSV